jgi:hypothetical protein
MSKEEKPTLAGATLKTRKRYIVAPIDPESFANAVIQIVQDAAGGEGASPADDLEAAGKALDAAEIEFARYGDTLFEVLFAGGRLASGAALAEGGLRLPNHVSWRTASSDACGVCARRLSSTAHPARIMLMYRCLHVPQTTQLYYHLCGCFRH